MRVIAKKIKDGFLIPFIDELKQIQTEELEVEVFIERSFTDRLRKTMKKFPQDRIDFKKEWHKHLEGKYNG